MVKITNEFNNYYKDFKFNFTILKKDKKRHVYTLKEGVITFKVYLKEITCTLCNSIGSSINTCNLKKCKHIYYIYQKLYNVPYEELIYLWINNNHINILNNEKMVILDKDIECSICLEDAGGKYYNSEKIIHCLECGNFQHRLCLDKVKKQKKSNEIVCINCYTNWLPNWMK